MALITKIQDKGKYLLVGVVGLSLILFIFTSLFDSLGASAPDLSMAQIDGSEINQEEMNEFQDYLKLNAENQAQQSGKPVDEQQLEQISGQAFQTIVENTIIAKECEKAGIIVTEKEMDAFWFADMGFPANPVIANNPKIVGANGKVNRVEAKTFYKELDKSKDPNQSKLWKVYKKQMSNERLRNKFYEYVNCAAYVTNIEAKEEYTAQNMKKNVSFVQFPFRNILDTDVKVSRAEIEAFYESNKEKAKYKTQAGRDIRYFDITIEASKQDIKKLTDSINLIRTKWAVATNDSSFATSYPTGMYTSNKAATFRAEGDPKAKNGLTYPKALDTLIKTASLGQIFGPYDQQGRQRIAKLVAYNASPSCSVRHILVAADKKDNAAVARGKVKADSILKFVNKTNFDDFVMRFSEDPGSKQNGGKYDDFQEGEMVAPFYDFASKEPVGKIGIVQTDYGFHIMEVLGRKTVNLPILSTIDVEIKPSPETENSLLQKANNILLSISDKVSKKEDIVDKIAVFDTLARKADYFARPLKISDDSPNATGFNSSSAAGEILRLAYGADSEEGDLLGAPIRDENRLVIAMLSGIREKGTPTFSAVYEQMKNDLIKKKKADKFKKQIGGVTNLKALAQKAKGEVIEGEITFASPSMMSAGYEPKIVGALFSAKFKDKQTTKAVVGDNGVYVIRINKTVKAANAKNVYEAERTSLLGNLKSQFQNGASFGLTKFYKVVDSRKLYEVSIPPIK